MIPQLTLLAIYAMSLGMAISKHGEEKIEKNNAWHTVLATILILSILNWGGFFDCFIK